MVGMRILIANDDGYLAPGLAALVRACEGLGHIEVPMAGIELATFALRMRCSTN